MRSRQIQLVVVLSAMALVAFTSVAVGTAAARAYSVTVTPDNSSSGTKFASTSGHTASFTITFIGDEMDDNETFDLWCSGTLGIQCSVQSTITLTPNIPENVDVTFSTSSQTGTGYVYLNALGWVTSFSDQGSRYYTVSAPVDVTSLSIPSTVVQHADDQEATFRVTNNGSGATFTMTCSWGAGPCASSPSSVYIGQGAQDTVTVTFDAGAIPATYEAKLTATAGANSDWASGNVTVTEFLSVNAVAQQAEVYAVPNVQRTDNFVVRFPGQSASAFAMSVACAGSLSGCSVNAADDTMNVGDTPVSVRVSYTAGGNGTTGTVTLTAAKVGSSWLAQAGSFGVIATSDILVSVDDANSGLEIDRGDCLTVAAGAGSIVCDDFQFVYPFTPVSRMNEARQLALIYNSGLVAPYGFIGANFVLPPGVTKPDSIRATLVMNTDTVRTQSYKSGLYAAGQRRRISFDWAWSSVPTGEQAPRYQVILQPWSGGSPQSSTTASGNLVTLSETYLYGRAWWIAGLEKLSVHGTDTLVWMGSDASGGVYVKSGSNWIKRSRSVPDTIISSGGTYVRRVLGGGTVHFNSSGYHTKTVDRNGRETLFNHTTIPSSGSYSYPRLTSVVLPTPAGPDTVYKLTYEGTKGMMQTVQVRSATGTWDTYQVHSRWPSWHAVIDSITAPDGQRVRFYQPDQLYAVYGPRGDTTSVGIHYQGQVANVTVKTVDQPDVYIDFRSASVIGRDTVGWKVPGLIDSVSTRIDGPLSGAADTTRYFVTGWGAVRGVRDALGNATWVDREDPNFPALPTRVRHPNGWEVTTAYNPVGLPDTIIDRSTGARTVYAWNNAWAAPTQITSPSGVVTTLSYDGSGNLLTRAVGSDVDSLRYNGDLLVDTIVSGGQTTAFGYDASGNLEWTQGASGRRTRYQRDYVGRPTLVVSPQLLSGDSVRGYTYYDAMGRDTLTLRVQDQDQLRTLVRTTYDAVGQVVKVEPKAVRYDGGWDTTYVGASEWVYDQLGRVVVAKTPVTADTLTYDGAGRLIRRVNNADTVSMTYDVLGRLRARRTSAQTFGNNLVYHPSGITIDAAVDTFTYDAMGRMLTAYNPFARVDMAYQANGLLTAENQSHKDYGGSSFTNQYTVGYSYDLDGRVTAVHHPPEFNAGTDRTDYAYVSGTNRLNSVTDALSNAYSFYYDTKGRPFKKTFPAGVDSVAYNSIGETDLLRVVVNGSSLVYDVITRNAAGQLDTIYQASTSNGSGFDYDGFGQVTGARIRGAGGSLISGVFDRDALGNLLLSGRYPYLSYGNSYEHSYDANTGGRLYASTETWFVSPPNGWEPGWVTVAYDAHGNAISKESEQPEWNEDGMGGVEQWGAHTSTGQGFYAADGKLMYYQATRRPASGNPWGAWEEYWYDALGRRVLRRSRQDSPICTDSNRCYSAIERYIWSGEQILWETRQDGTGNTKDPAPSTSTGQTGHVGYVHAGGIDTPIGMIRNDTTVVLHRNWRGLYTGATNHAGATVGSNVPWPAKSLHGDLMGAAPRPNHVWVGSLPMAQQDHSGLIYMRNRYYDPETGQFTQPDPIGFGGGYNLYGYAAGDAVNNDDPFGLTHRCKAYVTLTSKASVTCYAHKPPPGPQTREPLQYGLQTVFQDQVPTLCVVADACDPFGPKTGLAAEPDFGPALACFASLAAAALTGAGDIAFFTGVGAAAWVGLRGIGAGWVAGNFAKDALMRGYAGGQLALANRNLNAAGIGAAREVLEYYAGAGVQNTVASLSFDIGLRDWVPGFAFVNAVGNVNRNC